MKKFLTAMAILACAALPALAGPNAGGTILVHYAPVPVPPEPTFVEGGLTVCEEAVTMAPAIDQVLWFAYAAFPTNASPRVKVVSFGCDYDPAMVGILWSVTRPGAIEIFYAPDPLQWPQPGTGVAVAFDQTLTETVNEIYVFAGYGYEGQFFGLVSHPDPNLGGSFADDNVPSEVDMIAGYGSLGFGVPGVPACPPPAVEGACCLPDGRCEFVLEENCAGAFLAGVLCDPNPCAPAFACCLTDGRCQVLTQEACAAAGGTFNGAPDCDPDPCIIPVDVQTWGSIKNTYR